MVVDQTTGSRVDYERFGLVMGRWVRPIDGNVVWMMGKCFTQMTEAIEDNGDTYMKVKAIES